MQGKRKRSDTATIKKNAVIIVSILAALAIIPYINCLKNEFVLDDTRLIVDNPFIKDPANIGEAFYSDFWWGTTLGFSGLYRPVTIISYILSYSVSGLNPLSFHLISIILHVIVVLSIYYFLNSLYEERFVAFLAAALFAVHPIHTESVTWISGRPDLLAAVFFFTSLIIFAKLCGTKRSVTTFFSLLFLSLFLYFLALLSKESSIVLVGILPIILYFFAAKKSGGALGIAMQSIFSRSALFKYSGYLLVTGIYLLLRWSMLGHIAFRPHAFVLGNPLIEADLYERIVTSSFLFFKYVMLMIAPVWLSIDYAAWQIPLSSFPPSALDFLSLFVSGAFLFFLAFSFKRSTRWFFPLAFFFVTYSIVSNIFYIVWIMFVERFMYLPSLGFFLLLALTCDLIIRRLRMQKERRLLLTLYVMIGIILVLFAARTFIRNYDWRNESVLWAKTVLVVPKSATAHANMGKVLMQMGKTMEAEEEFLHSISIYPDHAAVYVNLGDLYANEGELQKAKEQYVKAIRLNPKSYESQYNLAFLYESLGETEQAIIEYRKAIDLYPFSAEAMNNLGAVYLKVRRFPEALKLFQDAYDISPDKPLPLRNQGEAYIKLNNHMKAEEILRKYLEIERNDAKAYFLLAYSFAGQERYEEAVNALKESIRLNNSIPESHQILSFLYKQLGQTKEAEEEFGIYQKMSSK